MLSMPHCVACKAKGGKNYDAPQIFLKIFSTILEVEIQNQDKVGRIEVGVSQFHGYANDLRGMGTEPRHQESVSQSIPSITVKSGCHGNWGIKPGAC